jgi:hypothetical protein
MDKVKMSTISDQSDLFVFVAYVIAGVCFAIIIWYWVAMLVTEKLNKCKGCCKFTKGIIMMLESILAIIFSLLGLLFLATAGVLVNVCHYQYKIYTDVGFYAEIQPNEVNAKNFFNACLYTTSPGLITSYLIGNEKDAFNKLLSASDGIAAYNTFKDVYATSTVPPQITAYKTSIAKVKLYSVDDFTKVLSAHQPSTVLNTLNAYVTCVDDFWVINTAKCPSGIFFLV